MKKQILGVLILFLILIQGCESDSHPCGPDENDRIGARCNDETISTSTSTGACSNHGGVKYWICD